MKKTLSRLVEPSSRNQPGAEFHFDAHALIRAARSAVREALRQHKRAGHSVAGMVRGKIVVIPASRIKP
jgi:hypothetical protein